METIATAIRWIHVAAGFVGLAAFWVPVFAKKGGPRHVLFGKIFEVSAYIVLAGAALSVVYRLVEFSGQGIGIDQTPMAIMVFLGYLTFVTYATLRQALAVLRTRRDEQQTIATPLNFALAYGSILASMALITYALTVRPPIMILLLALSPIGIGVGTGNLKYLRGKHDSQREWFYQHMGGMLGAGIAFHTAFAVFGVTRLFDVGLTGWVAVIPWVAPAAIGIPTIAIWTRYYRRKFGELPAHSAA